MATQEVGIKQTVHIVLKSDAEMLDDVVVVAYGTAKKSSFTGSAAVVDSKKIEKIYGKEFLSTIGENEKLAEIFNNVRDVESLQELNDIIAEKEFNIERQKEYSREDTSESENKFIGRISNNGEFRDNSYLNIKGLNSYLEKQNEDNNRSQERESSEEIER